MLRTDQAPASLTLSAREAVRELDPSLPVYRAMPLAEAMRVLRWNERISGVLFNSISAIAFMLALVGLFAATAHSVGQRRREIGVRMAVGAMQWTVGALILRRALFQLGVGVVIGLAGTAAFDRLFITSSSRLTDSAVLLPTVALVILVGAAASLWPATTAARLDPMFVLRSE
jgi:ABC-type antimicrobial peptide transport system permease subunit